ncbi:MAG: hypothetical protein WD023_03625 [Ilumatobacteraceae bacterium]
MSNDLGLDAAERFVALGRHQLVLRAGAFAFPLVALGAISSAASAVAPAMVLLMVPLALGCALLPDSHVGLLAMVVLLVHHTWVVDDVTSPWMIVVAISFLGMHTCMAAATVAPPGARWSSVMRRRWTRRIVVVLGATAVAWLAARLLAAASPGGASAWVLGPVLVALAGGGAWAHRHSIDRVRGGDAPPAASPDRTRHQPTAQHTP